MKKERTIGLDLGTTNSLAAYINANGIPEIIPNREGGRMTPSVYAVDEQGERIVGKPAVDQEALNTDNTVRSIKRHMGTDYRTIVASVQHSPEAISAEILKKIKADCEAFFGEPVTQAVITVPAYFNSDQRQATKTAGELAGFKVLRVINEPTAAALAYGLDKKKNETVVVYDLGGGTFDVTVLKITDDGVFEVKATAGDTHLGGDDFDRRLEDRILDFLSEKYVVEAPGIVNMMIVQDKRNLRLDSCSLARIRDAAEQAKKDLSTSFSCIVNVPFVGVTNDFNPFHLRMTLHRSNLETDIAPLLVKTLTCVKAALKDAGVKPEAIDEVILVGGSTRVPAVGEMLEKFFTKRLNRSVNPDEAVALGAAIQAGILSGDHEQTVLLLDVIPLSVGVETVGGVMTTMIRRNTTIPTEHAEMFSTYEDAQNKVDVRVFQGERAQVEDNKFLGEFSLLDLPPTPRGVPQIEVTFDVDANGILAVSALDKATGQEQQVVISGSSSLNEQEVAQILTDAEANADKDRKFRELQRAVDEVRDRLLQVETLQRDSGSFLPEAITADLEDVRASLMDALEVGRVDILVAVSEAARESFKEAIRHLQDQAAAQVVAAV